MGILFTYQIHKAGTPITQSNASNPKPGAGALLSNQITQKRRTSQQGSKAVVKTLFTTTNRIVLSGERARVYNARMNGKSSFIKRDEHRSVGKGRLPPAAGRVRRNWWEGWVGHHARFFLLPLCVWWWKTMDQGRTGFRLPSLPSRRVASRLMHWGPEKRSVVVLLASMWFPLFGEKQTSLMKVSSSFFFL